MIEATKRNTHHAAPFLAHLLAWGGKRAADHDRVVFGEGEILMTYENALERCVLWPELDVNPFVRLFNGLWLLAGDSAGSWIARAANVPAGPLRPDLRYEPRLFHEYIWSSEPWSLPALPLLDEGRAVAQASFIKSGHLEPQLHMVVGTREHLDNQHAAHVSYFTMLQEYVAAHLGLDVGRVHHSITHLCASAKSVEEGVLNMQHREDEYPEEYPTMPLVNSLHPRLWWSQDLAMFCAAPTQAVGYRDRFFRRLAVPMMATYVAFARAADDLSGAETSLEILRSADPCDVAFAAGRYIARARDRAEERLKNAHC